MKRFKSAVLLAIVVMTVSCTRFENRGITLAPNSTRSSTPANGTFSRTLTVNGEERRYRLYVPTHISPASPAALVINFHGLGANAAEEETLSGMSAKAESAGFIVAYPEGLKSAWGAGTGSGSRADLAFISALVQALQAQYPIDPKRIFAAGFSNGGGMANRAACDLSGIFAAIGPVSGAYNLWEDCHPTRPVPVITFHGTADKVIPFEGTGDGNMLPPIQDWAAGWAARNGCDPSPKVTFPGQDLKLETWGNCKENVSVELYVITNHGHSWPGSRFLPEITSQAVNATDVMWDFFQAHPRP